MIKLSINLPDWFLIVVTLYFLTRASFTILGIYFRRRASKLRGKLQPMRRR